MSIDEEFVDQIRQLNTEELQCIAKLVCLIRYCPGFYEELKKIVSNDGGGGTREQLKATNALMDKWLYLEGWAGLLRSELEGVGVFARSLEGNTKKRTEQEARQHGEAQS